MLKRRFALPGQPRLEGEMGRGSRRRGLVDNRGVVEKKGEGSQKQKMKTGDPKPAGMLLALLFPCSPHARPVVL